MTATEPLAPTTGPAPSDVSTTTVSTTTVDLVIPVYNEEAGLEASVRRLDSFLDAGFPYPCQITIADNASTDRTLEIATRLAAELPRVQVRHLDAKGRGRALKRVWSASEATILAYMDVDLSTDLNALLPLVAPLISGHSDIAIGSRLSRGARVVRGPKREFISRCYNLLLRGTLQAGFSDAQCGFKAIRSDVAAQMLPLCEDDNWFFDTELLVLAQRSGLRIHEVPVDWVDDPDSRVDIIATATEDLRGIVRLGLGMARGRIPLERLRAEAAARRPAPAVPAVPGVPRGMLGQVLRFGAVGVASTVAYMLLFWLLRGGMSAQVANLIALVTTAILNTAANRRLTFGVRGRTGLARDHAGGLLAFAVGLALTSGSLALLHLSQTAPPAWLELTVLTTANALATVIRFLVLRLLMHHRVTDRAGDPGGEPSAGT